VLHRTRFIFNAPLKGRITVSKAACTLIFCNFDKLRIIAMQKWIFLMFFIVAANACSSQVTFEKNYYFDNCVGANISPGAVNTKDSGYMVITFNQDSNVANNFFISLTRLNKQGDVVWNKNSDLFTEHYDYDLGDLLQYPDSSLVMLWNDQNSVYTTGYVHVDKNGNALWSKKFYSPAGWTYMYMNSFARTYDNGLIGLGDIQAYPSGLDFRFLLKTDSSGNLLWCKQYFPDTSLGYAVASAETRVTLTPDSGFLITFESADSISSNIYTCLMKTDVNGNIKWAKRYNLSVEVSGFTKPQISNGSIYLPFSYGPSPPYITVLKTTMQGIPIWYYKYTGMNWGYGAVSDNNGNTFLSGVSVDSLGFIFKIDSSGNVLWSHKYGKPDSSIIFNILLSSDGGVLGNGFGPVFYQTIPKQSMLSLIKTDAYGQDGCEQPITINRVTESFTYQNAGIKVYNLALTQKDTILNFYSAQIDTTTLCPVKSTVGINNIVAKSAEVNVYPNPNAGTFTIALENINEPAQVEVYNVLGEEIYQSKLNFSNAQINLGGQPNGIYLYRVIKHTGELIGSGKLIIEK
jgi:Secretion system C-terminal sorting domain